jgi:hypothetical protein
VIIAPINVRFWGVERTYADHFALSAFDPERSWIELKSMAQSGALHHFSDLDHIPAERDLVRTPNVIFSCIMSSGRAYRAEEQKAVPYVRRTMSP